MIYQCTRGSTSSKRIKSTWGGKCWQSRNLCANQMVLATVVMPAPDHERPLYSEGIPNDGIGASTGRPILLRSKTIECIVQKMLFSSLGNPFLLPIIWQPRVAPNCRLFRGRRRDIVFPSSFIHVDEPPPATNTTTACR